MLLSLALICFSFAILWIASNLVVVQTAHLSKVFHTSFFSSAFIILGILTSFPELSIGVNAAIEAKPEIIVGNLLGASFVLIALLIPLYAVIAGGIKFVHDFTPYTLLFALFVISLPAISCIDGTISVSENIMMICSYILLIASTGKQASFGEKLKTALLKNGSTHIIHLLKVLLGIALMAVASKLLIDQTFVLTNILGISLAVISLLVFSLGTNLPELFIGIRSVLKKKKNIALGHYIGSAATNTFIFGLLMLTQQQSRIDMSIFQYSTFLLLFVIVFLYAFSRTKNTLSRKEGFVLLSVYIVFVCVELLKIKG